MAGPHDLSQPLLGEEDGGFRRPDAYPSGFGVSQQSDRSDPAMGLGWLHERHGSLSGSPGPVQGLHGEAPQERSLKPIRSMKRTTTGTGRAR